MKDRPSRTAVKIARGVLLLAAEPRTAPILPAGAADATRRLLVAARLHRPRHERIYASAWLRALVDVVERLLPGAMLSGAVRKRFVDDETRAGIADGARQVLVVGAGLDTLSGRLAREFPDVLFLETDHPATGGPKRAALESLGDLPANLVLRAVDLAETKLDAVLDGTPAWRRGALSVVVAEGVLMYLDPADVSAFLAAASAAVAPGSRLVFDRLEAHGDGRLRAGGLSGFLRPLFRALGEPIRWTPRPEELVSFLGASGWRLDPPPDLRARYLVPAGRSDAPLSPLDPLATARAAGRE